MEKMFSFEVSIKYGDNNTLISCIKAPSKEKAVLIFRKRNKDIIIDEISVRQVDF